MPICTQRSCGCALRSDTLVVSGSGTGVDPWVIDDLSSTNVLPYYTFLNVAERDATLPVPQPGQECWIRALNEQHHYTGTAWKIWNKDRTAWPSPTFNPSAVPAGFTHGNAVITGGYSINAGEVEFDWQYTVGSTTSFGSSTNFTPQIPYPAGLQAQTTGGQRGEDVWGRCYNGGTIMTPLGGEIKATQILVHSLTNPFTIGNSTPSPFTWGPNMQMEVTGRFRLL